MFVFFIWSEICTGGQTKSEIYTQLSVYYLLHQFNLMSNQLWNSLNENWTLMEEDLLQDWIRLMSLRPLKTVCLTLNRVSACVVVVF